MASWPPLTTEEFNLYIRHRIYHAILHALHWIVASYCDIHNVANIIVAIVIFVSILLNINMYCTSLCHNYTKLTYNNFNGELFQNKGMLS